LYERGWFGLLVVLALGIAFIVIAIRLARRLPSGRWTTAFTLAVPGVVVVMGIYAVLGTLLQNRAVSLTFWLIVALGLSAAIPTVGQSDRRKPRSNQAPGARLGGW
jgi:heme A synthase